MDQKLVSSVIQAETGHLSKKVMKPGFRHKMSCQNFFGEKTQQHWTQVIHLSIATTNGLNFIVRKQKPIITIKPISQKANKNTHGLGITLPPI